MRSTMFLHDWNGLYEQTMEIPYLNLRTMAPALREMQVDDVVHHWCKETGLAGIAGCDNISNRKTSRWFQVFYDCIWWPLRPCANGYKLCKSQYTLTRNSYKYTMDRKIFNSCYYGGNQADVDWSTRWPRRLRGLFLWGNTTLLWC